MDYNIDTNNFDIKLIRGISEVIRFWGWEKLNSEGNIVPFVLLGKEIKVQFRSDMEDNHVAMELNFENGGLILHDTGIDLLFGLNTLNLCKDLYYYDVLIIDDNERIVTVRGKIILTGTVTQ